MTLFYLCDIQGTDDLKNLPGMISLSKPSIVALNITEKTFQEKYQNLHKNENLRLTAERLEYLLKVEDKDFMKELPSGYEFIPLFMTNYCYKHKCKILPVGRDRRDVERMRTIKAEVNKELEEASQKSNEELDDLVKTEVIGAFYVDKIMEELKPKFSLFPSSPYKSILGFCDHENIETISDLWKTKFKSVYGHEIYDSNIAN